MSKSSLQESLLEIFILSSILKTVKCTLNSSFEKSIEDLPYTSRSMGFCFMLSLSHRLASMMPMLECLRYIQILNSLSDLYKFSWKFLIVYDSFSNSFKACSHQFTIPFSSQFIWSFSHVNSYLWPLEPLSHCFSLLHELNIWIENFLSNS
jgi:hypothetical protein